jgi:Uma2 family endonuclease
MTPDEFLAYCSNEDKFCELIRGEVISVPPAGMDHSEVEGEAFVILRTYVKANGLGTVWGGDAGFILERDPFTVRSPDISFLAKSRFEGRPFPKGFCPGAPELAVEIISPSNSLPALEAKARMYLRAGGKAVWIMDPTTTTVRVYRPEAEPKLFQAGEDLDAEPAIPGFRCPVWKLFGREAPEEVRASESEGVAKDHGAKG